MNKSHFPKVLSLVLALALSTTILAACGQEQENDTANGQSGSEVTTIYAATGGSPRPFSYVDENDVLTGHNIELIEAIFDRLPQYELKIEVTEFTSIFAGMDADRYQIGVNNFVMNDERKEKYLFSDPIFENRYVVVFANDSDIEQIDELSDLVGKSYIGSAGVNMTIALESYNEQNPDAIIEMNYTEADMLIQIQEVESGRYDFLIMDKPMFDYYMMEYPMEVKAIALSEDISAGIMQQPYSYLLISKGNEALLEDINAALAEVIADGTSAQINEKYFGEDYTPKQ